MTGLGASMGNGTGESTGDGTGQYVSPWKLGVSPAAMMGRST